MKMDNCKLYKDSGTGSYLLLPLAGSSSPAASSGLDWLGQQSTPLPTPCSLSGRPATAIPPKHLFPPDPALCKSTSNSVFLLPIKPAAYSESKWWAVCSQMYFFIFSFSSLPPSLAPSLPPPLSFSLPLSSPLPTLCDTGCHRAAFPRIHL